MSAIPQERLEWEARLAALEQARPSRLREAAHGLARNKLSLAGSIIAVIFILAAIIGPLVAPYPYEEQSLSEALKPPGVGGHLLGTDSLGRDTLSRLLKGIQISVGVGFGTTTIALLVGTVFGLVSGYYRGWVDTIMNGFVEMVWGFPLILIAVLIVGALGPGLKGVILAVGFVNWAGFARIVRGEVLALREKEFVQGAKALGKSDSEIMFKHLLPNVLPATLVMGSYYIAVAVIVEAGLSFIGIGAQQPLPSLGQMVAEGRDFLLRNHWISTIPGITIVLLVLGLNLLGDGLRDILDPRLRRER